jgi:hypothetical protein
VKRIDRLDQSIGPAAITNGQYMVDTTSTSDRNSPASVLKDEAGAPDKMIDAIEQTIMRFRLEDFDRRELRECALAVLEVVREGVG